MTTSCAGGAQCFALPLVNKAGTVSTISDFLFVFCFFIFIFVFALFLFTVAHRWFTVHYVLDRGGRGAAHRRHRRYGRRDWGLSALERTSSGYGIEGLGLVVLWFRGSVHHFLIPPVEMHHPATLHVFVYTLRTSPVQLVFLCLVCSQIRRAQYLLQDARARLRP